MSVRRYHVFGLKAVTAIDEKDVQPLLDALLEIALLYAEDALLVKLTEKALEPFQPEEEQG